MFEVLSNLALGFWEWRSQMPEDGLYLGLGPIVGAIISSAIPVITNELFGDSGGAPFDPFLDQAAQSEQTNREQTNRILAQLEALINSTPTAGS